jgi:hypothetical protein
VLEGARTPARNVSAFAKRVGSSVIMRRGLPLPSRISQSPLLH